MLTPTYSVEILGKTNEEVLWEVDSYHQAIQRAIDHDGNAAANDETVIVVNTDTGEIVWDSRLI